MNRQGVLIRLFCFFTIAIFLVQGMGVPLASASSLKDGDFGAWTTYEIEKKLNDHWKIKAGEDVRFREHSGLYYYDTHFGVAYKVFPWLTLGGDYLEARNTRSKGNKELWYWESRPRIYATFSQSWKGFLLQDRNMLEFRMKQYIKDTLRYRNLVTLTTPWKWTRFQFQPYTANEIFIETTKNGVTEDRFYAGFKAHWWGPLYGSIYYLRDVTKNSIGKWKALNTLGTSLKLSF